MKLSVVIPCYNEKNTINEIVKAVKAAPYADKEIVIVDDCSTDGTREILKTEISPLVHRILYHDVNSGKGAALRTGIRSVTGDVVIIQDADCEYGRQNVGTGRDWTLFALVDGKVSFDKNGHRINVVADGAAKN